MKILQTEMPDDAVNNICRTTEREIISNFCFDYDFYGDANELKQYMEV